MHGIHRGLAAAAMAACIAALGCGAVMAQPTATTKIATARYALTHTRSDLVKQFAQMSHPRIAAAARGFARMTLPTLEDHLRTANQLVASQAAGNRFSG
jgi:hypothetical protein